jgi:taurine--2-oxoglutarate transaminase
MREENLRYTMYEWGPQHGRKPLVIERARGVRLWDYAGRSYLDFSSQAVNVNIGHADPRVVAQMVEQLERLPYVSPLAATEVRGRLGKRLSEIAPGALNKAFFTLGGAEANENAVRAAGLVSGRRKVLARYRSYHGGTAAMLELSGDPRRWDAEPVQASVARFWGAYPYRCRWCPGVNSCNGGCVDHVEDVMVHEGPNTIAAMIIEPVPGGYGVIIPPRGYLTALRELCTRYEIRLIADEVMSGFGRTGRWFAVDHEGVVPDLMTVSKGLTSGHAPLGACLMADDIAGYFETHAFPGGLTFNSYPLGCAAALATLEVFDEDDLLGNARRLGDVLSARLQELHDRHPAIGDVRSIGLFGAIELVRDRATKEPFGAVELRLEHQWVMDTIRAELQDSGLLTNVRGSTVVIAPPLCITEEELEEGLAAIDAVLATADRMVAA